MLIDKFSFQTDFLFYKKNTKFTLNLRRSLGFSSAYSSRDTVIISSRANLSLDLLTFFLENDNWVFSSTSTFHLCTSRCILPSGEEICWICLNSTALAHFLACIHKQMVVANWPIRARDLLLLRYKSKLLWTDFSITLLITSRISELITLPITFVSHATCTRINAVGTQVQFAFAVPVSGLIPDLKTSDGSFRGSQWGQSIGVKRPKI